MKKILAFGSFILGLNVQAQNDSIQKLKLSGYAEVYYTYDFNQPKNNQLPNYLYSFNRHNEVNLNFGTIQLQYNDERVRGNLALMAGTYVQSNLAAEPDGLRNIYEANISVKLSKNKNLWLDAGIMPSHIGFESAIGANVATLTRSIQAENSPYFSTGVKLGYISSNNKWAMSLHYLNGWQRIKRLDGNSTPAFGHQITYTPNEKFSINSSSFIGSDTPDSLRQMRYFHHLYAVFKPIKKLSITAGFDIGAQQKSKGSDSYYIWYSPILVGQYTFNEKWSATARAEYYADEKGVIISTNTQNGFKTVGFSLNLDHYFTNNLMWRTEIRSFSSKDDIYFRNDKNVSNETFFTTSLALKL